MHPSDVHPDLTRLASSFVYGCASALPGLLRPVHLTGSGLTADWQPRNSDIDLVLVVSRDITVDDAAILQALHSGSMGSNPVDGIYLTEEQLFHGPDLVAAAPQSVDGKFSLSVAHGQLNWVTWLEVESGLQATVPAHGMVAWTPSDLRFTDTAGNAGRFCRRNLTSYWLVVAGQAEAALAGRARDSSASTEMVVWTTLGPPRLAATIDTGMVISKTEAGRFAARRWPRHASLADRAVASRSGEAEAFTVADALESVDLLRAIAARYHENPHTL